MIYTEYFVKGTQPTDLCPLHEPRSFMDAIAGVFGKESGPPPLPVGAAGPPLPSAPASTSGSPAAEPPAADTKTSAPTEEAPAQKKRGFWSRVFGGGRDKSDEDRKKEEERRKQEQKKEEERKRKSDGR
jgi:penicillin-binding protein 1B